MPWETFMLAVNPDDMMRRAAESVHTLPDQEPTASASAG